MLLEYEYYVNMIDDFSQEDIFLKRQRVSFFEDLGYKVGVTPHDVASKEKLKWFLETRLMGETRLKDAKVIFGD